MKFLRFPNKATYGADTDAYGGYSNYAPTKNLYSVQYRKNANQISTLNKANNDRRGYLGDKIEYRNASRERDDINASGIGTIGTY